MSKYSLIPPSTVFQLPNTFRMDEYMESERELWALFPESDGLRVNFVQIGLTAWLFVGVPDHSSELADGETYLLLPCPDYTMRSIRMRRCRRLTLSEYRMGQLTAIKLMGRMGEARQVMREIGDRIMGEEVLQEAKERLREIQGEG